MQTTPDHRGSVAFDVIGTCFALDRVRQALSHAGAPDSTLDLWFAQALRDSFALSLAGGYQPLKEMLAATLPRALHKSGLKPSSAQQEGILAAFGMLDPQPGAQEAFKLLRSAGWRLVTLTNGSPDSTKSLLRRAGVEDEFDAVLSCDSVKRTKPHPDVYAMARAIEPGPLWLVAAHGWDVAGAALAGLRTVWVSSGEGEYLSTYPSPDHVAPDLVAAAQAISGD